MKNKSKWHVLVSALLSLGVAMSASAANWKSPLIPVTKDFTLPNGLRVVLSEDHSVPVVSVAIVYDVGARDEVKGRSGFAHLFEHMMFEGSENVHKSEHFKYVQSAGGSLNASTHSDFTNYYEKLPSNQLELALWLESDRMRSLNVNKSNLANQLEAVKEEKRLRYDNQPYIPSNVKLDEMLFDNWTNGHSVIGSFEDLEAASLDDVRNFFKTYYAPNNAVMAIVGDFNPADAQKLVEKYFATIPAQKAPGKPNVTEPAQTKAKYAKDEDPHAQIPAFWLGWKAPQRRDPDYYALGLLTKILAGGESSRIYQRMIKGDEVALKADLWYDERRGPGALEGFFIIKPGNTAEKVRGIMWEELEKVKTADVSANELEMAKNQTLRDLFAAGSYNSLQRSLGRAELLAEYTSFYGDPGKLDEDLANYMKVTPEDIKRVAAKVFTKDGITVVDVVPAAKKAETEKPKASAAK